MQRSATIWRPRPPRKRWCTGARCPLAATTARFPSGVEPLSAHVDAPPELDRRLKQTGIVASREEGARLQPQLKPGQRLVTRAGDLWRWDGFTAAADGITPAAQRLAERNRLTLIESDEARGTDAPPKARPASSSEALAASARAQKDEQRLRQLWREAQGMLAKTRESLTAIERAARETESKLAAVSGGRARAEQDVVLAREAHAEADRLLSAFFAAPDPEPSLAEAQTQADQAKNRTRRGARAHP